MLAPLIQDDSSEARNSAALTTSSGCPYPAQRDPVQDDPLHPLGRVGQQRRGVGGRGHAGADDVGADAERPALHDQLQGQRDHAGLGGGVGVLRHELHAAQRRDRPDVDDRAAAARLEVRPRGAHRVVDEVQLVPHREVPLLDGQLVDRAEALGGGVVVEDVDAAVRRHGGVHPVAGGVRVTQVDPTHHRDLATRGPDGLLRRGRALGGQVAADDAGALPGEQRSRGDAHATADAGDQRDLARQPSGHEAVVRSSSSTRLPSGSAT